MTRDDRKDRRQDRRDDRAVEWPPPARDPGVEPSHAIIPRPYRPAVDDREGDR